MRSWLPVIILVVGLAGMLAYEISLWSECLNAHTIGYCLRTIR